MKVQNKTSKFYIPQFQLDSGELLENVEIAYTTYGTLSEKGDNAVLIFHALTGSHMLAGNYSQEENSEIPWNDELEIGWWDEFVGINKLIDTEKYFVVCANYLGGCYGTTGPNSIDNKTGLQNCVNGLSQIIPLAEKHGVILNMELLNSKVDHDDYMCDNSKWGVALCKELGSTNFKLLYDIYHMQISEGDIIRTINDNHDFIGHYHTAGVPGRNEIDQTQELFYPAIMKAISATGFKGFVAQEFIPKEPNPLQSLKKAIDLCDV